MEPAQKQSNPTPEQRGRVRFSGKSAAFCLVTAFALTGILIPTMVNLPTWIDFEIVLGAWWGIWWVVLATMLYHGHQVTDDHQLGEPKSWLAWFRSPPKDDPPGKKKRAESAPAPTGGWGGINLGADAGEGCLWIIAGVVALVLMFFLLWFVIEVAIPLVLFLLYAVSRGMLSHVINDRHRCEGSVGRSVRWGLLWATLYTTPLAFVVWFVHHLMSQRA